MSHFRVIAAAAVLAVAGVAMGSAVTPANALVIFQDDFERGSNSNTVGGGWTEYENGSSDVGIYGGSSNRYALLRDGTSASNPPGTSHDVDAMIAQLGGLDLTNYTNIQLSYGWSRGSTESSDTLYVEYKSAAATNWIIAATHAGNTGSGSSSSFTAGITSLVNAANVSDLQFRFTTNISQSTERFRIDNVVLTGDYWQIPEPATISLLGLGLLGAGIARRRRSR